MLWQKAVIIYSLDNQNEIQGLEEYLQTLKTNKGLRMWELHRCNTILRIAKHLRFHSQVLYLPYAYLIIPVPNAAKKPIKVVGKSVV